MVEVAATSSTSPAVSARRRASSQIPNARATTAARPRPTYFQTSPASADSQAYGVGAL